MSNDYSHSEQVASNTRIIINSVSGMDSVSNSSCVSDCRTRNNSIIIHPCTNTITSVLAVYSVIDSGTNEIITTSCSSIISLLIAVGYTCEEVISVLITELSLLTVDDVITSGLDKLDINYYNKIRSVIGKMITSKLGIVPSLSTLYKMTGIELVLACCSMSVDKVNVTRLTPLFMDRTSHPNTSCIEAVISSHNMMYNITSSGNNRTSLPSTILLDGYIQPDILSMYKPSNREVIIISENSTIEQDNVPINELLLALRTKYYLQRYLTMYTSTGDEYNINKDEEINVINTNIRKSRLRDRDIIVDAISNVIKIVENDVNLPNIAT